MYRGQYSTSLGDGVFDCFDDFTRISIYLKRTQIKMEIENASLKEGFPDLLQLCFSHIHFVSPWYDAIHSFKAPL